MSYITVALPVEHIKHATVRDVNAGNVMIGWVNTTAYGGWHGTTCRPGDMPLETVWRETMDAAIAWVIGEVPALRGHPYVVEGRK